MKYFSTRDSGLKVSASEAIARGLAPDGGLFVPEELPQFSLERIVSLCALSYQDRAFEVMKGFLEEFSETELRNIIKAAYGENFDTDKIAPLHILNDKTAVLELWHGPTCAFKDMALQVLPHILTASLKKCGEERKVCILVATSGDTGKAALEGFADVKDTKILVFYPDNGVSEVQKLQMITQSGKNVGVCAVYGNFDDAQTGVKKMFADKELSQELSGKGWFLSSANSINWGRLLPQIVYYFSAYCDMVTSGRISCGDEIDFAVPTGNFGDILAGYYAKCMGLPVRKLLCASNANNVLTDFIDTGKYDRNRSFHTTVSPSMDILVSSNLERLLYHLCRNDKLVAEYMLSLGTKGEYTVNDEIKKKISECFTAGCCDDEATKDTIRRVWTDFGYLIDTHTAVAYKALTDYRENADTVPTVVVSTASPFKFCDSVLNALGEETSLSGAKLIERLSEVSKLPAPRPLSGLDKREKRFDQCVYKQEMKKTVSDFLI